MGRVLLWMHWLCLKRDRLALVLAFVLPIVFFSIMTLVMEQMTNAARIGTVTIGIVDRDDSRTSRFIIEHLKARDGFDVRVLRATDSDVRDAARLLRETGLQAIAILPQGLERVMRGPTGGPARVELLEDRANPIYAGILADMLEMGLKGLARAAALSVVMGANGEAAALGAPGAPIGDDFGMAAPALEVERVDVFGQRAGQARNVTTAYWAAGIGVMFLLFAMAGAGAGLIDEEESGITERIAAGGIPRSRLLVYKWLFFAGLGCVQVLAMFTWGWLVYGVELFTRSHFPGFLLMTAATALSAAALGILLATACRTRNQLAGVSTVLILVMSALGGSMFPRFLMSPTLRSVGKATFNAWALDGYQKVFWYEAPVTELWPQLCVLMALTVLFMTAALGLARRRGSR